MFNLYCVGGEDDIEATVKSLIDAGTCDGVGTNLNIHGNWILKMI